MKCYVPFCDRTVALSKYRKMCLCSQKFDTKNEFSMRFHSYTVFSVKFWHFMRAHAAPKNACASKITAEITRGVSLSWTLTHSADEQEPWNFVCVHYSPRAPYRESMSPDLSAKSGLVDPDRVISSQLYPGFFEGYKEHALCICMVCQNLLTDLHTVEDVMFR